jgi:hypothetical protein
MRDGDVAENDKLVQIVSTSGLEKTKADYVLEKFQGYFAIASEWEARAKTLVVTSPEQTTIMKMAREGRLLLKAKRVDIEKARKELKGQSLCEGKAIDGIANVLKALIEPTEEYLERQERFVEIQEEERKVALKESRSAELIRLGVLPEFYDLANMPDASYAALVQGTKDAIEQQRLAELKAEQDKIEKEKEQERIRVENERLRREAEEKERQMAAERAKAEAEQKRLRAETVAKEREAVERERALRAEQEAKLQAEREKRDREALAIKKAADAKLQKEREEREKLAAQIKAQEQAKAKEEKRLADEAKKAQRAPDKEKLLALAFAIEDIGKPIVKSAEAREILEDTCVLLTKTTNFIRAKVKEL